MKLVLSQRINYVRQHARMQLAVVVVGVAVGLRVEYQVAALANFERQRCVTESGLGIFVHNVVKSAAVQLVPERARRKAL